MNALGQSVFLKALGWTLLDSTWQFGLLYLVLIFILSVKKSLSSRHRHGLALLLLFTGAGWFVTGFFRHYYGLVIAGGFQPASLLAYGDKRLLADLYISLTAFAESNINYLSLLYLLFVSALSLRFLRYFFHFHKIRTTGITKLKAGVRVQVQQLAAQLGISRKVQVWVSSLVDTPMIIGFIKPTILIPVASINYLSVQQLEAILLHELAHIKRNDYLINLFVITLEIAFFFNPFARLLIRSIKEERENSCDDWVLQFRFDPYQYASALLALEQGRSSYLSMAIAATGKSKKRLLHRVQRIMQVKVNNDYRFPYFSYFLVSAIVLLAIFMNGNPVIKNDAADPAGFKNISAFTNPRRIGMKSPAALIIYPDAVAAPSRMQKTTKEIVVRHNRNAEEKADPLLMYVNSVISKNDEPSAYLAAMEEPEKEFSIVETEPTAPPPAAELEHFPFVPGSSFSFNITEDTTQPKIKNDSYQERVARESLAKAKLAVDRINWKQVEKQLKSKVNVAKLRKEIQQSLEQLNWQEINNEVRTSLDKKAVEDLRASLTNEYNEVRKLKLQHEQFLLLQKDLQLQNDRYQREVEKQAIDIQRQIGESKVIVHI